MTPETKAALRWWRVCAGRLARATWHLACPRARRLWMLRWGGEARPDALEAVPLDDSTFHPC